MQRVRWYFARLRSMSAAEIFYRVRGQLVKLQDRVHSLWGRAGLPGAGPPSKVGFDHFRDEDQVTFFFQSNEQAQIQSLWRDYFPHERKATIETADALLDHRIRLFDFPFELSKPLNWHRDPKTQNVWPKTFYGDIDIRDGETIGGPKWVWEINRHHHLTTLAKAYFLTGEAKYADEACSQLSHWIDENPPLNGVNWTSSLELSIRLINWCWCLAFLRDAPQLSEALFLKIQASAALQAAHIARHLSGFSSANNHLVGEAAGLVIAGTFFPWLRGAKTWQKKGWDILLEEMPKQIRPDGTNAEQAPHYLIFVFDFYLLTGLLGKKNGIEIPQLWYDGHLAACEFLRQLTTGLEGIPQIGDNDDAWVVRLDDRQNVDNVRSILNTSALIFNNKNGNAALDEKTAWLTGIHPREETVERDIERNKTLSVFRDGGYVIVNRPPHHIVFDCGPLGYLSTAAHGHADALSVLLAVEGKSVLIDPGTYGYHEAVKWRSFFRSTMAHNTITIDWQDQSEMKGTFLWGRRAHASLLNASENKTYSRFSGRHDGYAHLGVTHEREILYLPPDWLVVVDRFSGTGEQTFAQHWHFDSRFEMQVENRGVSIHTGEERYHLLALELPDYKIDTYLGSLDPLQGWASKKYGHLSPAPVVTFSGRATCPFRLITGIRLSPDLQNEGDKFIMKEIIKLLGQA